MTRTGRIRMFWAAAAVIAAGYAGACARLPGFGTGHHPYGERAVTAALDRRTANAVASVTFDQRGFDTLGEEFTLFAAVLACVVLLRRARDERTTPPRAARVPPTFRVACTVLLPVTLVTGFYVVAHGQLTPGGGFQGGVVLATGLHVAYLAADYRVLRRIRPRAVLDVADAVGAGAFAALGFAGLLHGAAYLENVLPLGTLVVDPVAQALALTDVVVGAAVTAPLLALVLQIGKRHGTVDPDALTGLKG